MKLPAKQALRAAQNGDVPKLQALLAEHGLQILTETTDGEGSQPLHRAAANNQLEAVAWLLRSGVDADCRKNRFKTPLMEACRLGHLECAHALLDAGAAVDALKSNEWSSLLLGCNGGFVDVVLLLLERGADLHHQNREGQSGFYLAAREGHAQLCAAMLERARRSAPAEDRAAKGGDGAVSMLLSARSGVRKTALHIAAMAGRAEVLELLLEAGAAVDAADKSGLTPLHDVCSGIEAEGAGRNHAEAEASTEREYERAVQLLLRAGADAEAADICGRRALHYIAVCEVDRRRLSSLAALLSRASDGDTCSGAGAGARAGVAIDVNAVDDDGASALYLAVARGHEDAVCTLLEIGADASLASKKRSPLHVAVMWRNLGCMRLLLAAGAEAGALDAAGQTALQLARELRERERQPQRIALWDEISAQLLSGGDGGGGAVEPRSPPASGRSSEGAAAAGAGAAPILSPGSKLTASLRPKGLNLHLGDIKEQENLQSEEPEERYEYRGNSDSSSGSDCSSPSYDGGSGSEEERVGGDVVLIQQVPAGGEKEQAPAFERESRERERPPAAKADRSVEG